MKTKNIKCFTEGPKAIAKSSMYSQTTIAVPDAYVNNTCIFIQNIFVGLWSAFSPLLLAHLALLLKEGQIYFGKYRSHFDEATQQEIVV